MDGAGTRMRRGLLRRWSCAGLSWKTHRSTSALYCPRTALFARHDRLLGECRQNGLLNRELLQFAQIQLPQEMESRQVEAYQHKKGQLQQAIEERRPQIEQLKAQRKTLPKHIEIKDLPEQDRFHRLRSEKKHFIDTIKLIAYRAETALAQLAREKLKRLDDARSLIRQLFRTEVDLVVQSQPISGNGGHDNYGRGENGAA